MSTSLQPVELRRHLRVDFQRRAWCEHSHWTLYLPIANLSRGGLFIQTPTMFAKGERLRVCLSDRTPVVVVEVEVVWSSTRGRVVGVGCVISSFTQGAEAYASLVEQLEQAAR